VEENGTIFEVKEKRGICFQKMAGMRCCGGVQRECEASKEQLEIVNHRPEIQTAEGAKNASRNVDVEVERLCWLSVGVGV
jgi:hypothetical protein